MLISTQYHANLVAVWARSLARTTPQLILREATTLSVACCHAKDVRTRMAPVLARAVYPRADVVVAVSEGVAEDLVQEIGVPRSMIRVIYNPAIDDDVACLMKQPADHAWLNDDGPPVILSVGRLGLPPKRFETLIRAVDLARRRRPIRLVILGDGEERPRLEALVAQLEMKHCVSLPGFNDNPYAYMARAALYVVSSAWEGFPNTLC